jgi:hypothetical protein
MTAPWALVWLVSRPAPIVTPEGSAIAAAGLLLLDSI